ncbi:MAG: hypothetical protein KC416_04040 [Myxococcales bacterium]|nr:hypothetical protein [Myxococcales bacterium]
MGLHLIEVALKAKKPAAAREKDEPQKTDCVWRGHVSQSVPENAGDTRSYCTVR